jgi:MtN3 and saliva related transmembrane protein
MAKLLRKPEQSPNRIILMPFSSSQFADFVGYLAAILTTSAFIPQAWLTWKTRSASGISLGMYSVFVVGVACWLLYGISLHAWPVIIANAITLSLATFILGMKIRFG